MKVKYEPIRKALPPKRMQMSKSLTDLDNSIGKASRLANRKSMPNSPHTRKPSYLRYTIHLKFRNATFSSAAKQATPIKRNTVDYRKMYTNSINGVDEAGK